MAQKTPNKQKKTGSRFIASHMTNFDFDIILSNIIANYEKKISKKVVALLALFAW